MRTSRCHALLSAAALPLLLVATACAGGPSPVTHAAAVAPASRTPSLRFDNEGRATVRVYLISDEREWMLGRVEPGMRASLRLPSALPESTGIVRLAAIADADVGTLAARDPRTTMAIAQPIAELAAQRWTFTQSQAAAPQLFGARAKVGSRR